MIIGSSGIKVDIASYSIASMITYLFVCFSSSISIVPKININKLLKLKSFDKAYRLMWKTAEFNFIVVCILIILFWGTFELIITNLKVLPEIEEKILTVKYSLLTMSLFSGLMIWPQSCLILVDLKQYSTLVGFVTSLVMRIILAYYLAI